jgi:hypothetical protein
VTHIGITGHQNLGPATRRSVSAAVSAFLAEVQAQRVVGVTSLAEGADQLFAFSVLAAGGDLHAVIPSTNYETSFSSPAAGRTYASLLDLAASRESLPFSAPSEDAYLAAGERVVDRADILLAVWDGAEAAGKGGTGDVVAYARDRGVKVHIVWPPGAKRG